MKKCFVRKFTKIFFPSLSEEKSLVKPILKLRPVRKIDEITITRLYQGVKDTANESIDSFDKRLWDYSG